VNIHKTKSFGVIPVYKDGEDFYVLLVKNAKGGHWGLPKGTPEVGERPIETAKRELAEETGITDIETLKDQTFQETYEFDLEKVRYQKTNTYFVGFVKSMDMNENLDEIDEIKWVKTTDAANVLTYQGAARVVKELEGHLKIYY